jgi:hypothetical protein
VTVDCGYYTKPPLLEPGLTHEGIAAGLSTFDYQDSLLNDWDVYADGELGGYRSDWRQGYIYLLWDDRVLLQFRRKVREPNAAAEAVIVIHGSGSDPNDVLPDLAISPRPKTYMNEVGHALYAEGYDIFSPYVTHDGTFLDDRRRMASTIGQDGREVDIRRILMMVRYCALRYQKVYLTGASYGGLLALLAYKRLYAESDPSVAKIPLVLAIEGWCDWNLKLRQDPNRLSILRGQNWEMCFTNSTPASVLLPLINADPKIILAQSSCNWPSDAAYLVNVNPDRILLYTGAHEYLLSTFQAALARVA